ncbi:hypothetical protein ACJRO7_032753 [Eucalyptus globulus]|uniref:LRAT domain-containing protein n=1 Tax=Eucalyptus globulus TaxID=34317 RepID=A0ABD3JUQ3_EUCGL
MIDKVFAILMLLLTWNAVRQEDLKPGDHIYTYRLHGLYTHHGIYIGEGYVIHFTRTGVNQTCLDCFRREGEKLHPLHLYAYGRPLLEYWLTRWGTRTTLPDTKSSQEVVNNARELHQGNNFGEYDLINNNCEHFASFCRTGVRASAQTAMVNACEGKIKSVKEWAIKLPQRIKFSLTWVNKRIHRLSEFTQKFFTAQII